MATRFTDKETGEILTFDDPADIAAAEQAPEFERFDLRSPVLFVDKKTNEKLWADDMETLRGFDDSAELRRSTAQELEDTERREREEERKRVEAEAGRAFLEQRPLRTSAAAGLASFAKTTLPFGIGEKLIEVAGLPEEQQQQLAEAAPVSSAIGTGLGIAGMVPAVLATGGASAEAQVAGRAAAAAARARGAGRLAQSLAAARSVGLAAPTAAEVVSPLMATGARIAGVAEAAITGAAPALQTGLIGRAAAGAIGAGLAGALPELTEAAIERRPVSGEAIVSQMKVAALLGGAVGGAVGATESLAPVGKWFANTETARTIGAKLGESRAKRIYNAHAPGLFSKVSAQAGAKNAAGPISLINEAADQGLVSPFDDAISMMNKVQEAKRKSGDLIGRISAEADASLGKPLDVSDMWDRMSDRVILPMSQKGPTQNEVIARKLMNDVKRFQEQRGNSMTLSDLAKLRSEVDDQVYGFTPLQIQDPERTQYYNGLRQFRHILTEEIGRGVQESGIPINTWKAAQKQYQVVSHAERVAAKAIGRFAHDNKLSTLQGIENLMSVGTALLSSTTAGVGTKAALASARYVFPRVSNWAQGAAYRATNQKAPSAIVGELQALQKKQALGVRGQIASLSVRPEDAAREQFLGAYDNVLQTIERAKARPSAFPKRYLQAAEEARRAMEDAYAGLRPAAERPIIGMSTVLGPDGLPVPIYGPKVAPPSVEKMGDAIEKARNAFSRASTPLVESDVPIYRSAATEQEEAVTLMRGMRDDLTGLLADKGGLWGQQRLAKAEDEMAKLYATYTDPGRLARLKALQDEALRVKKEVASRADRIMGSTGAAAPKTVGSIDKLYDEVVNSFSAPAPLPQIIPEPEPLPQEEVESP